MNDRPHSDQRPAAKSAPVGDTSATADATWDVVSRQLDQVLPRLTALGTRAAVLAPALVGIIGIDSWGRGVQC